MARKVTLTLMFTIAEMEAIITANNEPEELQFSKELFSAPIPSAGIEIPGIFKLGATLSYEIGVGASVQGSATIGFGLRSTVPDSAKAILDLTSEGDSSATGFDGNVEPTFDVKEMSASVTLSAFLQLKLAFGIELTKIGNADVALSLELPELSSTLSAEYDDAGLCRNDTGVSTTGVKISSQIAVLLDAQADLDFGKEDFKPSFEKNLFNWNKTLGEECLPLAIPGLPVSSTASLERSTSVLVAPTLADPLRASLAAGTRTVIDREKPDNTTLTTIHSPSLSSKVKKLQ